MKKFQTILFLVAAVSSNVFAHSFLGDDDFSLGLAERQMLDGQFAAHMSLRNQQAGGDGLAPVRIFSWVRFQPRHRLMLISAEGDSVWRIYHNKIEGRKPCPDGWLIHFTNRRGEILPAVEDLSQYLDPLPVPHGAVAAYIGYRDSAYFDNEGIRFAKGSTNGCTFDLALVSY